MSCAKRWQVRVCGAAFFLASGLSHPQTGAIRSKFLAYNLHHGEGTDGRLDLQRIAGIINSINPVFAGLQEIDSVTSRTGGVNQAAEYARLTGMNWVFGKAISYGGGSYGNATLSDLAVTKIERLALPGTEARMALFTDIDLSNGANPGTATVTFITTHLMNGEPNAQLQSARLINAHVQNPANGDTSRPLVLLGDMNAVRNSAPINEFLTIWNASNFNYGIDWFFFRPANRWRFLSAAKLSSGDAAIASDHLPVEQEMELLLPVLAIRPLSQAGAGGTRGFFRSWDGSVRVPVRFDGAKRERRLPDLNGRILLPTSN